MRKSISRTRSRWIRAGITTAAIAAIVIAAAPPAFAAAVTVTLSAITGPSTGGNTITASATTAYLSGYTAPGAAFTVPACPATYSTTPVTPTASVGYVPASVVKKLANTKAAITVPSGVVTVGSAATTKYNVCIYGTQIAGSALLGNATYTVAVAPTVTSVTPSSGPAQGGSTITVTGTGFPTTAGSITATIGGSSLLSITPVSTTSFTAVTPAHAAGANLTLSVGTTAGTLNKSSAYSYTNGIVIGPNTAPNTAAVDIDVQGVGFLAMDFTTSTGSTPDDTNAHVYLINGAYSNTGTPKANAEVAECTDVIVIGDTELICSMQIAESLDANGLTAIVAHANTTRTVTDAVTATSTALTSATAAFTTADIGSAVTGTNIAANSFITAVGSATAATLNNPTSGTGTGLTVTIGGPRNVTTGTAGSTASTTLASTALFVAADAGRAITGTGIAPNTTIASFTNSSAVVLSQAPTATISGGTLTIGQPLPVPNDTYTVTVVDDGRPAGVTVSQSIVSSGATFTVSPY
jgi:hypothetical protein